MDHPDTDLKISYSESGTFGNYDLAEALVGAEYSNKAVSSHLTKKELKKEMKKNDDAEEKKKSEKAK